MPYELRLQQLAVKDDNDNYTGFDVLAEKTTQQTIKDIEAAGDQVKNSVATEVKRYITSMTSSSTSYYTVSSSGTTRPSSGWSTTIPTVPAGQYLWTRINITFTLKENVNGTITSKTLGPYYLYSVARSGVDGKNGQDGTGAVSKVNNVSPTNGNVSLNANNIPTASGTATDGSVQASLNSINSNVSSMQATVNGHTTSITSITEDVETLETYEVRHVTATLTKLPLTLTSYSWVTANHRIINCYIETPSALASDLSWTTSDNGSIKFDGTLKSGVTTKIDFDIVKIAT